jgi:uncharacterized cupredoxin-like copper-binding protein
MDSRNRSVIVNEDDNRKLEIYTQGDLDASPSGIGMFASDANGTLRILKQDDKGNLNVNLASGSVNATIGGTMAVYFDQSAPTVNATGAGGSISVNVVAGGAGGGVAQTQVRDSAAAWADVGYSAGKLNMPVYIAGSAASSSLQIIGITNTIRVGDIPGSIAVYFSESEPTVKIKNETNGTIAVKFNSEPTVVTAGKYGTTTKHHLVNTDGAIKVYDIANGTVTVNSGSGTLAVRFSDQPYVVAEGKYGAVNIPLLANTDGAIKVYDVATGSINVKDVIPGVGATNLGKAEDAGHTSGDVGVMALGVKNENQDDYSVTEKDYTPLSVDAKGHLYVRTGDETMSVRFSDEPYVVTEGKYGATKIATIHNTDGALKIYDIANGTVQVLNIVNVSHTASIESAGGSVSGSTSGVSVSGVQLVSPIASRTTKVYAFSIMSTAAVNLTAKFTNGSGASPVELWRVAMISPAGGVAGANLAVTPPGYLFATPSAATLCLVLDSASLVHYSVSYFREAS